MEALLGGTPLTCRALGDSDTHNAYIKFTKVGQMSNDLFENAITSKTKCRGHTILIFI